MLSVGSTLKREDLAPRPCDGESIKLLLTIPLLDFTLAVCRLRSCPDNPFQGLDYKAVSSNLAVVMYYSLIIL